jgi:glycosyltransferase involved in cell wall biosynthesis
MKFTIATPSFRNSEWLKLCIPSVADQGVEHEHIVQDAGSDDGTLDWLPQDKRVAAHVEKDRGMYDAVNRAFRRGNGDVFAYLNCDEQYLPGALGAVERFFTDHPEADVAIADIVVTDRKGDYLCHRYALRPLWSHLWYRFNVSTAALFLRKRVLSEHGLFFQPEWKHLGDFFWIEEAVRRGLRFGVLREFTSVFTETGVNISWDHSTRPEEEVRQQRTPRWVKALAPLLRQHHRLRILLSGAFQQRPFSYSLYTLESAEARVTKQAATPTTLWPGRREVIWGGEKGVSVK